MNAIFRLLGAVQYQSLIDIWLCGGAFCWLGVMNNANCCSRESSQEEVTLNRTVRPISLAGSELKAFDWLTGGYAVIDSIRTHPLGMFRGILQHNL